MATYRAIAGTETDPGAPLVSALLKALDGNATAIAEGAAGAPRIEPDAINSRRSAFALPTAGTSFTLTSLNSHLKTVGIDVPNMSATSTGSGVWECWLSLSNDNGSSFAAEVKVATASGASSGISLPLPDRLVISLADGFLWLTPQGPVTPGNSVIAVPAGGPVNAIRWRLAGSVGFSSGAADRGLIIGVGA